MDKDGSFLAQTITHRKSYSIFTPPPSFCEALNLPKHHVSLRSYTQHDFKGDEDKAAFCHVRDLEMKQENKWGNCSCCQIHWRLDHDR